MRFWGNLRDVGDGFRAGALLKDDACVGDYCQPGEALELEADGGARNERTAQKMMSRLEPGRWLWLSMAYWKRFLCFRGLSILMFCVLIWGCCQAAVQRLRWQIPGLWLPLCYWIGLLWKHCPWALQAHRRVRVFQGLHQGPCSKADMSYPGRLLGCFDAPTMQENIVRQCKTEIVRLCKTGSFRPHSFLKHRIDVKMSSTCTAIFSPGCQRRWRHMSLWCLAHGGGSAEQVARSADVQSIQEPEKSYGMNRWEQRGNQWDLLFEYIWKMSWVG